MDIRKKFASVITEEVCRIFFPRNFPRGFTTRWPSNTVDY